MSATPIRSVTGRDAEILRKARVFDPFPLPGHKQHIVSETHYSATQDETWITIRCSCGKRFVAALR